jgi:Animal haem peroxidase
LGAPSNAWFTFFGQFFDHGLDLVTKGGQDIIFIPLQPDDPLYVAGSPTNFMVETRATNVSVEPGLDGILGTADDIHNNQNTTTPFIDQNQTYTSHPSHQVFLRAYQLLNVYPDALARWPRDLARSPPASCSPTEASAPMAISAPGTM